MPDSTLGPIEHIRMQETWHPDCTNCGKAVDVDKVVYTRHTFSDGMTGNAPWCPKCYARWNPEDTDDREEPAMGEAEQAGFRPATYRDGRGHESARVDLMYQSSKLHGPTAWADDVHCWFAVLRKEPACRD